MSSHHYNYEDNRRYSGSHRGENFFGEILGEIPIVGELFKSLGGGRIGKKGMKKICCCCAPIVLVMFVPIILLFYWLAKIIFASFNINIANIDWLAGVKNWFVSSFQLDQIFNWFGGAQGFLGM